MDIEIVDKLESDIMKYKIDSAYDKLLEAFKWVDNEQGESVIKQCIDNILTDALWCGKTEESKKADKRISVLNLEITRLRNKYEEKEKDISQEMGYGQNKYTGD